MSSPQRTHALLVLLAALAVVSFASFPSVSASKKAETCELNDGDSATSYADVRAAAVRHLAARRWDQAAACNRLAIDIHFEEYTRDAFREVAIAGHEYLAQLESERRQQQGGHNYEAPQHPHDEESWVTGVHTPEVFNSFSHGEADVVVRARQRLEDDLRLHGPAPTAVSQPPLSDDDSDSSDAAGEDSEDIASSSPTSSIADDGTLVAATRDAAIHVADDYAKQLAEQRKAWLAEATRA